MIPLACPEAEEPIKGRGRHQATRPRGDQPRRAEERACGGLQQTGQQRRRAGWSGQKGVRDVWRGGDPPNPGESNQLKVNKT